MMTRCTKNSKKDTCVARAKMSKGRLQFAKSDFEELMNNEEEFENWKKIEVVKKQFMKLDKRLKTATKLCNSSNFMSKACFQKSKSSKKEVEKFMKYANTITDMIREIYDSYVYFYDYIKNKTTFQKKQVVQKHIKMLHTLRSRWENIMISIRDKGFTPAIGARLNRLQNSPLMQKLGKFSES